MGQAILDIFSFSYFDDNLGILWVCIYMDSLCIGNILYSHQREYNILEDSTLFATWKLRMVTFKCECQNKILLNNLSLKHLNTFKNNKYFLYDTYAKFEGFKNMYTKISILCILHYKFDKINIGISRGKAKDAIHTHINIYITYIYCTAHIE